MSVWNQLRREGWLVGHSVQRMYVAIRKSRIVPCHVFPAGSTKEFRTNFFTNLIIGRP